ncbi:MAG: alpha/beta hydrolase [Desulfobacteraceae bacterium]|nr:alpha/beta hydrolase [Desulfobacteraceae bacterium]
MKKFKKITLGMAALISIISSCLFFTEKSFSGEFMIYENNDTKIYYEIHGKGKPLVLIAGLASDSQSWITIIPELSKHFQVIVFDNRTTGRTKSNEKNLTIDMMGDDAANLIKYLKLENVSVLGHSMGGIIAADAASKNPDLIKNLIIAASPYEVGERIKEMFSDMVIYQKNGMDQSLWFKNFFYWILTDSFFENKELLRQGIEYNVNYPYPQTMEGFEKQVNAMNSYNGKEIIKKIRQRTLVIAAEKDRLFSVDQCRELADKIENSKFKIIKNAAHSIHSEMPSELANEVLLFLNQQ